MQKKISTRYSSREIALRVDRERAAAGVPIKAIAAACLTSKDPQDLWYRRIGSREIPFTVEELGLIAEYLDMPPLWPFAERDVLERLWARKPAAVSGNSADDSKR